MTYLDLAAGLVKRLEGCRLTGYPDTGGVATDGWGNTHGARIGVTITMDVTERDLDTNLREADARLLGVAPKAASLDDHQRAALISFVFNLGAEPGWTIWSDVQSGNLDDVPTQMLRFDHGKVSGRLVEIPGLKSRRQAEIAFFETADVPDAVATAAQAAPPSSYTRSLLTPPVPAPPPPLAKASITNKVVTAAAGAITAAGTLGSQVHDIAAPHASEAHVFQMLAVGATGLVIACSILGLMIHAQQAQARTV